MENSKKKLILEYFSTPEPFVWGKKDCCLWAADIVKAIYGIDYAKEYRGKYSSEFGYKKLLVQNGYKTLLELVTNVLGVPRKGGLAKLGDPVLLEQGDIQIVGICYGTYALFLTETGFTTRDIRFCTYCWEMENATSHTASSYSSS